MNFEKLISSHTNYAMLNYAKNLKNLISPYFSLQMNAYDTLHTLSLHCQTPVYLSLTHGSPCSKLLGSPVNQLLQVKPLRPSAEYNVRSVDSTFTPIHHCFVVSTPAITMFCSSWLVIVTRFPPFNSQVFWASSLVFSSVWNVYGKSKQKRFSNSYSNCFMIKPYLKDQLFNFLLAYSQNFTFKKYTGIKYFFGIRPYNYGTTILCESSNQRQDLSECEWCLDM